MPSDFSNENSGINAKRSILLLDAREEFNSVDGGRRIAVYNRKISRREMLKFGAPTGIRDFDPKYSPRELQSACAGCYCRSADQRPCQQRNLRRWSTPQASSHNFVQGWSNGLHLEDSNLSIFAAAGWRMRPKYKRHGASRAFFLPLFLG